MRAADYASSRVKSGVREYEGCASPYLPISPHISQLLGPRAKVVEGFGDGGGVLRCAETEQLLGGVGARLRGEECVRRQPASLRTD